MKRSILLNRLFIDLEPLKGQDGVSELMINRPGEVWIEQNGQMIMHEMPELTYKKIDRLAKAISGESEQVISSAQPLISATLPVRADGAGGERVQIIMPPATERETIAISIRVPTIQNFAYSDYKEQGAFDRIGQSANDDELKRAYEKADWYEFIRLAVLSKKNIMNSGGTSTGKTTFTNALIDLIPADERLVTIEDARELRVNHPNRVHLLFSKGNQGQAKITARDLLEASLRLRPSRIIQSELRGAEAYEYLRGINTGHPGSISTVHADTAENAIQQINMMVMQSGVAWSMKEIDRYVRSVLDVVIQWKKAGNRRFISEVLWLGA